MSNVTTTAKVRSHPCRIHYIGEVGDQIALTLTQSKGYISNHGDVLTGGLNGSTPFQNGVFLTAYGATGSAVTPKNAYCMSCRLIGTNTSATDTLYYEARERIDLGPVTDLPKLFVEKTLDRFAASVFGMVIARSQIKEAQYEGKTTIVATVRCTDYDPVEKGPVSFCVKVYIPPIGNMLRAQGLVQVTREILFQGTMSDYDDAENIWAVKVNAINVASGHETANNVTSIVGGGGGTPSGGRVPMNFSGIVPQPLSSPVASTSGSSTVADTQESSPTPALTKGKATSKSAASPAKRQRKK